MSSDSADPYELLGLQSDARDDAINKAFRQKSLKVHPDRNPDNPEAARLFYELKQAQELLLDPARRAEIDASIKKRRAHAEKYAKFDVNRKRLQDELEEREAAFKKAKMSNSMEKKKQETKENELRDLGRRIREERERATANAGTEDSQAKGKVDMDVDGQKNQSQAPQPGRQDTTLRIKYTLSNRPDLSNSDSLSSLLRPFGEIDESTLLLSLKPPKGKPNAPAKFATAVVSFKKIEDAFGAVGASGRSERGLKDVDIKWATGEEPAYIKWLRDQQLLGGEKARRDTSNQDQDKQGVLGQNGKTSKRLEEILSSHRSSTNSHPSSGSFSSFPDFGNAESSSKAAPQETLRPKVAAENLESVVLMRMRQAERDRLAREILEAEEKGES